MKQTFKVSEKNNSLFLTYSQNGYVCTGYMISENMWQFELYSRKKYLTVSTGDINLGKRMIERRINK